MTDQPRRRTRAQPSARPVGAPNVLSNQATPNTLSTMGTTGGGISPVKASTTIATRPVVGSAPLPRPTIASGRPASGAGQPTTTDNRFERPRRRPTLGTIITIGFVVFWALRFINSAGIGGSGSSPTPRPTAVSQRTTPPSGTYGTITFGKSHGDDCALTATATSFSASVDVFWSAELLQQMPANAAITVVTLKNGRQIDYEYVPPDPSVGKWQVFCSGPAKDELAGTYRIEIWNADRSKLLAKGEFLRLGPSATPERTATATHAAASATP